MFTAKDVMALREMSGAGMMDCKRALVETDGDMDKAMEYLREKSLAATAKKASRIAAEGIVDSYIHMGGKIGVLLEVNCETDFVANGEPFGNFVKGVAAVVAKENPADVDALMGCPWVTGNGTVKDAKDELFLALRENMSIRRFARIADGFSVPYVHMKGKIGVIVNLTVEGCDATEIGKNIAGTGFDTNVVGRYNSPYASGGPKITRVAALDITDVSHGNGNGLGMLDLTTMRAYKKFSMEQTYPNAITSTVPLTVKIPMALKSDRQAIQGCIKTCNVLDPSKLRLVRIKNTIALDEIEVSEAMISTVKAHPHMELLGEPYELKFDADGNLF